MATNKSIRSQATFWGAAALLGVVALLAVVLIVFPSDKEPGKKPTPTQTAATGGCDVTVTDTSSTPKIPSDLEWVAEKGWTWPTSATVGPTKTEGEYGVCFARSPLGAGLAVTSFVGRFSTAASTDELQGLIDLYVYDSPGKKVARDKALSEGAPTVGTPTNLAGFSVDSFTEDQTLITLVFGSGDSPTGFIGTALTARWVDGDWKWQLLDDGRLFAGQPSTPEAGTFTQWRS